MLTLMHATAAGPDYILRAGKVYDLPRAVAKKMAETKLVVGATEKRVKEGKDEKEIVEIVHAGHAATILSPADLPKHLKKGQKVLKMNPRPDPEEQVGLDVDDGDEIGLIDGEE